MQSSVTENRDKFIGGSDIPVIMGISPFKTRWQLLQEKAGFVKDEFKGNEYTAYGNAMEGKIRDYINSLLDENFVEGKHVIEGKTFGLFEDEESGIGIRCHTDGETTDTILEIKTTGGNVDELVYKVQLLFYMMWTGRTKGLLAIYTRPDNMSLVFDPNRLTMIDISLDAESELVERINTEVDKFREDLKAIKNNPFLSEEDLLPSDLIDISARVVAFEERLSAIKAEEKKIKAEKQKLYDAMVKSNIKKWETMNGYKITRVDEIPASEKEVVDFDSEKFEEENPEIYKKYCKTVTVKVSGKAGYVKITPPKEK